MRYEVLNDDVLDKRTGKPIPVGQRRRLFGPMFIHIFLVFLLIIFLLIYFSDDQDINLDQTGDLKLVGDVLSFNETFKGNLTLTSTDFLLQAKNIEVEEGANNFEIINFNGSIYLENNSIIFTGTAKEINNGKNNIDLNYDSFKLSSHKKTNLNLYLDKLFLTFEDGKIILDESLNYEFKNSSISLLNYNASIKFDDKFSFSGKAENFSIISTEDNLEINYRQKNIK